MVGAATNSQSDSKPDLIIGLVGAVGTDLKASIKSIDQILADYGYKCKVLRLSDLIGRSPHSKVPGNLSSLHEDQRISALMDGGNRIRAFAEDAGAVSWLAIREMAAARQFSSSGEYGNCYILNSLKHKAEVETLRRLYNRSFYTISVYSPFSERVEFLKRAISKSHRQPMKKADFDERARELVRRDQNEPDNPFGQNVRDAFCQADLFVRAGASEKEELERFFRLLFGAPTETPTIQEHAMFLAKAASLRSADLSRQVGAAIISHKGQLLSIGCNEVPKAGGGHYWYGHDGADADDRDHSLGVDPNARMIRDMVGEVLQDLIKRKWITSRVSQSVDISTLVDKLFEAGGGTGLKELRAGSIIEFGRIVHAEMSALCDAALRGVALAGSTLVCTTFPCHMCARHIVASGISKVIYIEPYPKSLTAELYEKSVVVEAEKTDDVPSKGKVAFSCFIGVSPNRFAELFSYRRGKDSEGYAVDWKPSLRLMPRFFEPPKTIPDHEAVIVAALAHLDQRPSGRLSAIDGMKPSAKSRDRQQKSQDKKARGVKMPSRTAQQRRRER